MVKIPELTEARVRHLFSVPGKATRSLTAAKGEILHLPEQIKQELGAFPEADRSAHRELFKS